MNNLIEQFFDLEDRQRRLVCALAVLLLAGAYWYFVYSGRRVEMRETLVKIADLRDQRDHKQTLISSLDAVRGAVRELAHGFYRDLGLSRQSLMLNSMGDDATRTRYLEVLRAYYREHGGALGPDFSERVEQNPLRRDSK